MKKKKVVKKLDKQVKMFLVIAVVLAVVLVFLCVQNILLKKEMKELERQEDIKLGEGIDDFVGIIIEKVDTCLPVQLMSRNNSAIVLGIQCLDKK